MKYRSLVTNPYQCLMSSAYLQLLGAGEYGDWSRVAASNTRGVYIGHPYLPFLMNKLLLGINYTRKDVLMYAKSRIPKNPSAPTPYSTYMRREVKQSLYWERKDTDSDMGNKLNYFYATKIKMIDDVVAHLIKELKND